MQNLFNVKNLSEPISIVENKHFDKFLNIDGRRNQ